LRQIIFIFILLNLISSELFSLEKGENYVLKEYSSVKVHGLINHFITNREYYRAFIELKRLNSYYPGYLTAVSYHTTENYLLYAGRQFGNIINRKHKFKDNLSGAIDAIYKCDAFIEMSDYYRAGNIISSHTQGSVPDFNIFFIKRQIFTYIMMNKFREADKLLEEFNGKNYSKYRELINASRKSLYNPKNPYFALTLGLLPGMGYMYTGKIGTGVLALFVVSLNAGLSYLAFRTSNNSMGLFIAIIGTFFYTGSVVGGYLSAKKYNENIVIYNHKKLTRSLKLEEDREYIFNEYGIARDVSKKTY